MDILSFYENKYGEFAQIPFEEFPLWTDRAKAELNKLTFGQFKTLKAYTDDEIFCICEIAEALYRLKDTCGKSSENIDGCSVSYNGESPEQTAKSIAEKYLDSSLMYRGY